MAYNEFLGQRVKEALERRHVAFEQKKMIGGLTFMVDGKMCTGVLKDVLIIRIDPDKREQLIKKKGCSPMSFTGRRIMKGIVKVDAEGYDRDKDFDFWIDTALAYNPFAKASPSSRKKKK